MKMEIVPVPQFTRVVSLSHILLWDVVATLVKIWKIVEKTNDKSLVQCIVAQNEISLEKILFITEYQKYFKQKFTFSLRKIAKVRKSTGRITDGHSDFKKKTNFEIFLGEIIFSLSITVVFFRKNSNSDEVCQKLVCRGIGFSANQSPAKIEH